ncbi:hypothetical protein DFQ27_008009 [Actinomortierella ambigua]|uniref:rRNA-processing protein EFG1 n=1 Tax=Actinomortierella ambigua TaxID=1343610 RepID=A0A9P6PRK2_9FUNG|nr:hypothetical protein DFQ27_008009 [Actinomortierella ambigua]
MEASTTIPPQSTGDSSANKKSKIIHRRVAPSKAPARILKKQIRSLERLLANTSTDASRTLPEEKVAETKAKILALQKQLQAVPPSGSNTGPSSKKGDNKENNNKKKRKADGEGDDNEDGPSVRGTKGLKARELRRAGRKIVAFKKQHPNYEDNEDDVKTMADLELDLLYIKHFPRNEPYISIYPDEPHEDNAQITQAEIRQKIADAIEKGEIRHGKKPLSEQQGQQEDEDEDEDDDGDEEEEEHDPENPISNWSDDEDVDEEEDNEEDTVTKQPPSKKTRTK